MTAAIIFITFTSVSVVDFIRIRHNQIAFLPDSEESATQKRSSIALRFGIFKKKDFGSMSESRNVILMS